jgi:hypothetical protein
MIVDMLTREDIRRYLKGSPDLVMIRKVQKAEAFRGRSDQVVCIKEESSQFPFAVHPSWLARGFGTKSNRWNYNTRNAELQHRL